MRISFVCSGNICRSPTAEFVMRSLVAEAGADIEVESAGTGAWHVGDDMDRRARAELVARGYPVPRHYRDLRTLARAAGLDDAERTKVVLFGGLGTRYRSDPSVPDPYYGGPDGFADVLDRVEYGCRALLAHEVSTARLPTTLVL